MWLNMGHHVTRLQGNQQPSDSLLLSGVCLRDCSTFTLQQEVSPEGDDGRLFVQSVLLLRQRDGEEPTDRLRREPSRRFTEDAAEERRGALHLDQMEKVML